MSHILIIDDAADLRLLMRMALQSEGHTISDADGGRAGLQMLEALGDVDLVILDVQMPAMDGWDVLERMRRDPTHEWTPVLMCTVKFSHDDLTRAWELGCDGYLNKPFDLGDLTQMTQAIIATDPQTRRRRREDTLQALHAADAADPRHRRSATNGFPPDMVTP